MKNVMSVVQLDESVELKEDIDSKYWIIQKKDNKVLRADEYSDLRLALDCFHIVCEETFNAKELAV